MNMDICLTSGETSEDDMPEYQVVDHYPLLGAHAIERSQYDGEETIHQEAPEVVRKLAPGERAFISGSAGLQPFIVRDGLWINGTWMQGWRRCTIEPMNHLGESVYKCFEPVDAADVTSCRRVDGKWIVRTADGGNCTGATALYLVIVK
jgi:hypothetical protein